MGQQVTFFTQKDVQLTFFFYFKYIYRAESTFDKGNIQHEKRNFFRRTTGFSNTEVFQQFILSDRTFHRHIFCDEIWKDWRGPRGKNKVELELPALLTGLH